VRLAGEKRLREPLVAPSVRMNTVPRELERIDREAENLRFVPPWAVDIVDTAERALGKK